MKRYRAAVKDPVTKYGGTIAGAQAIAAHESPRTTKLYDRRGDKGMVDEVKKIAI